MTRYGTLDFLRGVAAITVVVDHASESSLIANIFPHAYLMVDFFFVLSGFILAYTYEARILAGLPNSDFMLRRGVRLYPLLLLGVLLGGVFTLLRIAFDPSWHGSLEAAALAFAENAVMLPNISGSIRLQQSTLLYPGNGSLWSVSFEILINVIWCFALVRLPTRHLAFVAGSLFVGYCLVIVSHGAANVGYNWNTAPSALTRVAFDFCLGVLICRKRMSLVIFRSSTLKIACTVILVAAIMVPAPIGSISTIAWDILCVGLVLPVTIGLALNSENHPRLDAAFGKHSYALFAIHFPILKLAAGLHQNAPSIPLALIDFGAVISIAILVIAAIPLYDEPMRACLARLLNVGGRRQPETPDLNAS